MAYIRNRYKVPAKRGMSVEVHYQPMGHGRRGEADWKLAKRGRITSASHHLHIDGGGPYHPTYGIVYLNSNGKVILDTREIQNETKTP